MVPLDDHIFSIGPQLSVGQKDLLCQPVQVEEIKRALFEIDKSKAPGPDGFSSGFFQHAWDVVKEEYVAAIQDFFKSRKLLKKVNSTNLTHIPKVANPTRARDFRPIACCNVVY